MSTPITNLCARAGYTYQAANLANAQRELDAYKVSLSGLASKFAQTQATLEPGSADSKAFMKKINDIQASETRVNIAMDANDTQAQLVEQAKSRLN